MFIWRTNPVKIAKQNGNKWFDYTSFSTVLNYQYYSVFHFISNIVLLIGFLDLFSLIFCFNFFFTLSFV